MKKTVNFMVCRYRFRVVHERHYGGLNIQRIALKVKCFNIHSLILMVDYLKVDTCPEHGPEKE